jgi:hypothetical protein
MAGFGRGDEMNDGGAANGNVHALVSDFGRHTVLRWRVLDRG